MSADEKYETALATAGELLGQGLVLPQAPGEPAAGAGFRKVATVHAFADSWTAPRCPPMTGPWSRSRSPRRCALRSRCAASCAWHSTAG